MKYGDSQAGHHGRRGPHRGRAAGRSPHQTGGCRRGSTNPHAGRYVEDLDDLIEASVGLSELLSRFGGRPTRWQAGPQLRQGGHRREQRRVGARRRLAPSQVWQPPPGGQRRGQGHHPLGQEAGGPGTPLDIPLHYKDAAFVRSHFDAIELRIVDAPDRRRDRAGGGRHRRGRPHPRVGGLKVEEIVGEDGLR